MLVVVAFVEMGIDSFFWDSLLLLDMRLLNCNTMKTEKYKKLSQTIDLPFL